jgi:hypothetical protein
MEKNKVFISFASKDAKYRDYLVEQTKNTFCPIEIEDWSVKEPFDSDWKEQSKEKIKKADVVIVLIGKNISESSAPMWEVNCAIEQKKPILGVYIDTMKKEELPNFFKGIETINWDWENISNKVNQLKLPRQNIPIIYTRHTRLLPLHSKGKRVAAFLHSTKNKRGGRNVVHRTASKLHGKFFKSKKEDQNLEE